MGDIDIKKVIIAIILVLALGFGIFFAITGITSANKNYELEEIAEKDYKYFAVYTEGSYGVLDDTGKVIAQSKYTDVVIPNPTKPVFICTKADGKVEVLNEKNEIIFTDFNKVSAIETEGSHSSWPYEKSVLRYEKDGKFGLIDYTGKVITKPIYEEIASVKYKEGEILAKKDRKIRCN